MSESISAKRQADLLDAERSYEEMKRNFAKVGRAGALYKLDSPY